ncbi:MAG: acetate kinase, partial [Polyangiaceae bacterium]|nr:acetate kinase [Polyangiaceae bacterium]
MTETVLALNAGSSTLKYGVYRMSDGEEELLSATVDWSGSTPRSALEAALQHLRSAGHGEPAVIGHRIVHGGTSFTAPVAVDAHVLQRLDALVSLAPLHLPPALGLLREAMKRCPLARHVACFDTSFHSSLPEVARRFALPADLHRLGVRRYGFHGLSCQFVLAQLAPSPPARLIVAHLGSGVSLTAVKHGRSIDTTMGMTPTGGLPMGTRSGDLDPGVLLHLLREQGYSPAALGRLVNHECGLVGLAGSSDARDLSARAERNDATALFALEHFAYAVKKQI